MNTKILFEGTHKIGKVQHLVFKIVTENQAEKKALVPVDQRVADHVLRYLEKFVHVSVKPVERGNEEEHTDVT